VRFIQSPTRDICDVWRYNSLGALSGLLRTDESDDARKLRTLCKLLLFRLLVHVLASRDIVANLQHPVLERQELGKGVVEEGRRESDVGGRRAVVGHADVELARWLLLLRCLDGGSRLRRLGPCDMLVCDCIRVLCYTYFSRSTKVMFSAISATRFAMRDAMIVYGEVAW
jgi:hypothetical protein